MTLEKVTKKERFILKAKNKFNDKYSYDDIIYVSSNKKISIKCNKHNENFNQSPVEHLRGTIGCPLCLNRITTTSDFIRKAIEIHGNKYDYSASIYINASTPIKIICQEHGEFFKLSSAHINAKQGCPKCGRNNSISKHRLTKEEFIQKLIKKHGNKYDYSLVNYHGNDVKIKIICLKHGEFEQLPYSHMRGKGCSKCAKELLSNKFKQSTNELIKKCMTRHGDKYDYSLVNYVNAQTKIKIICPKHGEFEQLAYDHILGHGCEKCVSSISNHEIVINDFINSLNINTETSGRKIIAPQQLDIYIPSHKIAIEFDGLYWHSEEFIDKNYHLRKTLACEKQDIRLIHIFEDEWLYKQDIVKSRIKNMLGLTPNKIYARKCQIKLVASNESRIFLNKNHMQGSLNAGVRLGLFYNNELVSLMLFNKPRLGIGSKHDGYELSRFANKLDTNVIGGADKLLQYFIKNHKPKQIISYADRRWSQGRLYEKLGFEKTKINKPNYWYIIGKERKHRFNYRKESLKKQGFNMNRSEHQIMKERKIFRIYDCGTITYFFK